MFTREKISKVNEPLHAKNDKIKSDSLESKIVPMPSPKVLLLDFDLELKHQVENMRFEVFIGSIGTPVKVRNNIIGKGYCCLPNYIFPKNIQEYEIVVIDLCASQVIEYVSRDHTKSGVKGSRDYYFYCKYPETIFDSRAMGSNEIKKTIRKISHRPSIIVVFANEYENINYTVVSLHGNSVNTENQFRNNNYEVIQDTFDESRNEHGTRMQVIQGSSEVSKIVAPYLKDSTYEIVFTQKSIWQNSQNVKDLNFKPLIVNGNNEIVGYTYKNNEQNTIVLPNIKNKSKLLIDLFNQLPEIYPAVFPEKETNTWRTLPCCTLPNQDQLEQKLENLNLRYNDEKSKLKLELSENAKRFAFLHEILSETGEALVRSIIVYLQWMGFDKIQNCDELDSNLKEEDIRIETEDGLIVIEVKGLFGTSKDEECSQISKIRLRRIDELKRFNIFGLYIVNHQRMLPPNIRKDIPFTEMQLSDSIRDKRGLLTTWQLFNLYFDIDNGIISKEDARKQFLKFGLIDFYTDYHVEIGEVTESLKENLVGIINLKSGPISMGDILYYKENNRMYSVIIQSIQLNGHQVQMANSGEIGLKFSKSIRKGTVLFRKR